MRWCFRTVGKKMYLVLSVWCFFNYSIGFQLFQGLSLELCMHVVMVMADIAGGSSVLFV